MGLRGPLPKPAEQRLREGSAAHRPLPRPTVRSYGMPARPKGLTAAERKHWDFYMEHMERMGVLNPVDGPSLALLCRARADYDLLSRQKRQWVRSLDREAKPAAEPAPEAKPAARRIVPALVQFEASVEGRRLDMRLRGLLAQIRQAEDRFGLNSLGRERLHVIEGSVGTPYTPAREMEINPLEAQIQ